jgi:hypothetical protein
VPEEENEREASSSNKKQCVRKEECVCPATTATPAAAACESERCVVCMDDYQADEEVALLPCKHFFHIPCTEGWLAVRMYCDYIVPSLYCTCSLCSRWGWSLLLVHCGTLDLT